MSWDSICYPLKEGGLDIKRIKDWNRAAMAKHIWRFLSYPNSIWSSWIQKSLLRGKNIWQIRCPSRASWAWRKILACRDWCEGLFVSKIGNGEDTSLWFDIWLPEGGRIYDRFVARTIASTGLNWTAKVASIIRGGDWNFPTTPPEFFQVWNNIRFKPKIHENDHIVWKGHATGNFTVDSAWNMVRKKKPINPLHGLIWYTGNVPRYAMNLWLASMGRLSTMDRPHMANIADNNQCFFCGVETESHRHLFLQCSYSAGVWQTITSHTTMYWPNLQWEQLLNWAANHYSNRKGFNSILMRHTIAIAVYFIWKERNCRVFQGDQKPASVLAREVIMQLRLLLMSYKGPIPDDFRLKWNI